MINAVKERLCFVSKPGEFDRDMRLSKKRTHRDSCRLECPAPLLWPPTVALWRDGRSPPPLDFRARDTQSTRAALRYAVLGCARSAAAAAT